MPKKVEYEILLCGRCKGEGVVESMPFDVGRLEYEEAGLEKRVCKSCNGSGRQIKTITTTIEPYENEDLPEAVFNELKRND